ncbi:MAG: outer membrane beta-barrel protein [Nitrosomonadales bacterium]|nr:outer membrane beta-barrel protein [Nitrosomonadales bacterium]
MNIRSWGWMLMGCAVAMPALAQDGDYNVAATNSYALLSAGRSSTPAACDNRWLADSTCSSKGTIYRLGYGYNLNSLLGVEISYGDFAHAREDGIDPTPPAIIPGGGPIPYYRTWSVIGWELAAVATVHLGQHLSLHGKAGWLRANMEEEVWYYALNGELWHGNYHETRNTTSVSGGIQYDFNRDVGLRFQVNRYNKLPGAYQLDGTTYRFKTTSALASLVLKF